MERTETDGKFVDFDVWPFASAHPRRGAPGQKLRIARNVGNKVEELSGSEG
jgi:hypothetical protein